MGRLILQDLFARRSQVDPCALQGDRTPLFFQLLDELELLLELAGGLGDIGLELGIALLRIKNLGGQLWDPLESTCRHASLSIL